MKKLKLKALELGANEVLTRAQLKNVMGGDGSGGGNEDSSQCGSVSNCSSGHSCTFKSGVCAGYSGTCNTWNHGQNCGCTGGC